MPHLLSMPLCLQSSLKCRIGKFMALLVLRNTSHVLAKLVYTTGKQKYGPHCTWKCLLIFPQKIRIDNQHDWRGKLKFNWRVATLYWKIQTDFHPSIQQLYFHKYAITFYIECFNIAIFLFFKPCPRFSYFLVIVSYFQHLQDINSNQSSHATFKIGKCLAIHILTYIFYNRAIYSHNPPPPPTPHEMLWPTRCLKTLAKASPMLVYSILLVKTTNT